eukprot:CAMPEP_0184500158 /NCGR_PEP_ID=MMETSP0113_2-20130426/43836_1 /TAXON_ID=91329 /ORGANISM="Norrisiella sphaerica, Strain BC52" /LENGTH=113 /DNA_ID=CAMNT_0026888401 /DNA_START=6 /DNA_END=347 /DNA_ORIENTATION=+
MNCMGVSQKVRERQWAYLGPIAAAPLAHIAVSLYKNARTPFQRKFLVGFGVIGATAASVGMRLYLMQHSGYLNSGDYNENGQKRLKTVTEDEKKEMISPSMSTIAKDAAKGFA